MLSLFPFLQQFDLPLKINYNPNSFYYPQEASTVQLPTKVKRKRTNDDPEYKKAKVNFMQMATKYMQSLDNEDEYDVMAKRWALQLRQMDATQRLHGEKLINDVLYEGLLGKLTYDRRIADTVYKNL